MSFSVTAERAAANIVWVVEQVGAVSQTAQLRQLITDYDAAGSLRSGR